MKTMTVAGSSTVFVDDRGRHRVLRMSWHAHHRIAVLSLWNGQQCTATFRLPVEQVPAFVQALSSGLVELANTAEATAAHREQVAESLLREPAASEPAASRSRSRTDTVTRTVTRGLDAVIQGCTRLRERLHQR